jgi:hypothetical protein
VVAALERFELDTGSSAGPVERRAAGGVAWTALYGQAEDPHGQHGVSEDGWGRAALLEAVGRRGSGWDREDAWRFPEGATR